MIIFKNAHYTFNLLNPLDPVALRQSYGPKYGRKAYVSRHFVGCVAVGRAHVNIRVWWEDSKPPLGTGIMQKFLTFFFHFPIFIFIIFICLHRLHIILRSSTKKYSYVTFFSIIKFSVRQPVLLLTAARNRRLIMEMVCSLELVLIQSWHMDTTCHTCLSTGIMLKPLPKN